ncbi:MAG TPA: site-2 protease family protein, partial [Gemmatimonadaceae bacterium]|nr:site-2 protease family protein [Gemmatimonadaceae bacterium]
GDSLLLWGARAVMGVHGVLLLSPLALAGWAGILVTMINLLPLAQLDGGHVAYALFGRGQTWIARLFWVALLVLGWRYWFGWYVWAAFGLLIGRGRLSHPMLVAPERTLDPWRRAVGWIVIALFIVTFMPLPAAV